MEGAGAASVHVAINRPLRGIGKERAGSENLWKCSFFEGQPSWNSRRKNQMNCKIVPFDFNPVTNGGPAPSSHRLRKS